MNKMILAAALMSGCINDQVAQPPVDKDKVSYLCVGMENSKRFGACPGCMTDAKRLSTLMRSEFGYAGDLLISDEASKAVVVSKLKQGIEATPEDGMFMFFYSGHGGQEYLGGKEPDGADRQDEFLCLYDTYMLDDEIWDIVSKCKGRVFLYFDACHSATMYRSVKAEVSAKKNPKKAVALAVDPKDIEKTKGFTFRPEKFVTASAMDAGSSARSPKILCWSGCKEAEYSYGGGGGGTLTIAVVGNWSKGCSYGALWDKALRQVQYYQPDQHPVQTNVGGFSKNMEAFR